jgi:hypothetical protein
MSDREMGIFFLSRYVDYDPARYYRQILGTPMDDANDASTSTALSSYAPPRFHKKQGGKSLHYPWVTPVLNIISIRSACRLGVD